MLAQAGGACPSGTRQGELPQPPPTQEGGRWGGGAQRRAVAVPCDSAPPAAWHLEHVQAPKASPRAPPQLGQHRVPSRGTLHSRSPPQRRPPGSCMLLGQGGQPPARPVRGSTSSCRKRPSCEGEVASQGLWLLQFRPQGLWLLQFRPAGPIILTNPLLCPDVRREAHHRYACRNTGSPSRRGPPHRAPSPVAWRGAVRPGDPAHSPCGTRRGSRRLMKVKGLLARIAEFCPTLLRTCAAASSAWILPFCVEAGAGGA